MSVCACVCVCVRACVRAGRRACVRAGGHKAIHDMQIQFAKSKSLTYAEASAELVQTKFYQCRPYPLSPVLGLDVQVL